MDPQDRETVIRITQAIEAILRGEIPQGVAPAFVARDEGVHALGAATHALLRSLAEAGDFISSLSKGLLDIDAPARNFLISPFKQLHANLNHLTWQTKQVARGDLSQHVDFMGEFSDAFNSMIASLQEKRRMEEELRAVHLELLEANTRVMDSIQYARTIQAAFLPHIQEIASHLREHFIIWKPKDIIGGDMYKFKTVPDGCLLAVMDCTGHGVPGALMTMIAGVSFDSALEDVGYHQPSKVLQRLNGLIKDALNQHDRESASDDGLDIGVCFVNKTERKVVFSGAGIGLYHVTDGTPQEVRPDRQSIGYKSSRLGFRYTDHTIPVHAATRFYMTSDGMLHQTGGRSDLPFGKKRFKRLLSEHYDKRMSEQERFFEEAFDSYRGDQGQLDDVTLFGFVVE